ncbi:MAG: hypothetical protein M3Q39_01735 [Actinomycetota bacterium]|nr:hypothetical protein [Actinomycetota bacterium]
MSENEGGLPSLETLQLLIKMGKVIEYKDWDGKWRWSQVNDTTWPPARWYIPYRIYRIKKGT